MAVRAQSGKSKLRSVDWSKDQLEALAAIRSWLKDPKGKQVFYLAGYAGCGKTEVASQIWRETRKQNSVGASFTGRAASVMRRRGISDATTIHSLIKVPVVNRDGKAVGWRTRPFMDAGLVICDEVSMLGRHLGSDLLSYEKRVLCVGDEGQLPPVRDNPLLSGKKPDFALTEIHRQAKGSPIISLSVKVRKGEFIEPGEIGDSVRVIGPDSDEDLLAYDVILCGLNRTRRSLNHDIREQLGHAGPYPLPGEKVICLRNDADRGLLNGMTWSVLNSRAEKKAVRVRHRGKWVEMQVDAIAMRVQADEEDYTVDVWVPEAFWRGETIGDHIRYRLDEFDFAYAVTCHKAQGGQWPKVLVVNESSAFPQGDRYRRQWLYTAITRAEKELTVVMPPQEKHVTVDEFLASLPDLSDKKKSDPDLSGVDVG